MLDVLLKQHPEKAEKKVSSQISERADKPIKSLMKSISWRIVGTLDTMIISYFITGRITVALSIGSVEVFTKTVLYYFHERIWAHIHRIRLNIIKSNDRKFEIDRVERPVVGQPD
jgi:uncharacterized membrane protein